MSHNLPLSPQVARWLAVAGGVAASAGALAQTAGPPVATLQSVVVTASGFEQDIREAPASISVVTREELEQGAYRDLTDALRDVPGVILTPSDNNTVDISLRGMSAQYTLILVDGKRIATRETQTNGSTGTDQSWIPPLGAIERIEVVRGPMSSLYGSDAIGGVINIITRRIPQEWGGSVRVDGTLQQHRDSGDMLNTNFYLAGPIKDDLLGLSVQGKWSRRWEDQILNGYNDHRDGSVSARLAITPNVDHTFLVEGGVSRQKYRATPDGTLLPDEEESERDFHRSYGALTHEGRWGIGTSNTVLQYDSVKNVSRDMTIRSAEVDSSLVMPLGMNHITTVGVYFNRQNLDDTTTNRISDLSTADRTQYAAYAENEWAITDTFNLTTGLRFDHDSKAGSNWSPRLYGVWEPAADWTVKGGVSTGFRAPSLRQTIPDWGAVSRGGNMYGNPNLKPEKSVNTELGVLYALPTGGLTSLTVFHNRFRDKITRVACPECGPPNQWGRDPTTYTNVDNAITQGVEWSLSTDLTDTLALVSSYTYTDSEQKSGEYAGSPLNQLPRHMFNAKLDWEPNAQWRGWAQVTFRGQESEPTTGPSSSTMIAPSSTLVDLGGSYQPTRDVTLYAGIYNLFDKSIVYDDYGYVEDGRRFWLGAQYEF